MASVTDITPAGNQLFRVTLEDERGTSEHEVTVPDGLAGDLLGDDAGEVALKDVVLGAMDWRMARESRQDIPDRFSLGDLRGVADFDEQLPGRARRWAASEELRDDRSRPGNPDEKLVEQVRREQEAGDASTPRGDY